MGWNWRDGLHGVMAMMLLGGVRAEVGVRTESSRGMWPTREEKCMTEDMDTRASVVSPRRPQRRFLMGEAGSGNWRGALHCTERESSRAHWPGCPWLLDAVGGGEHEGLA